MCTCHLFLRLCQCQVTDLSSQNEELKIQVVSWHRMFSAQVRLREGMKRLMAELWHSNPLPLLGFNDINQVRN